MNSVKNISNSDLESFRQKISEIEAATSAEIVCAVATESSNYDRAESIVGLLTGIAALSASHLGFSYASHSGDWHFEGIGLFLQIAILSISFVAGNYLAAYVFPIRRAFVSSAMMVSRTERAARNLFNSHVLGKTRTHCGVLIYFSLFERKVVVLADEKCHAALGDDAIRQACNSSAKWMQEKKLAKAIENALDQLSLMLVKEMPANRQLETSEIDDHLLLLHRYN